MTRKDIPNLISAFRVLLVPPALWMLLNGRYDLALMLFAVAAVSDGIDGYLARHNGWGSRLGAILDPLADKLLMDTFYIALVWLGDIPLWLMVAVIGRDAIIVLGAVTYHFVVGRYEMAPSIVSKLNTFCQVLVVVAILWSQGFMVLPEVWIDGLIALAFTTTVLSGITYVWTWGRRAYVARKRA